MVIIKNPEQISEIKKSCQLLAQVMEKVKSAVQPGVTTVELNGIAEELIEENGGKPAFKGYRALPGGTPFPSALCSSVNHQVVHGMSISEEPLKEGDIVGLDLGINLDGYFSDMAVTLPVGNISEEKKNLLAVTQAALMKGIEQIKPGNQIRDIAQAIEETIKPHNYGIVREFVGHGVGVAVHEDPRIPNYISEHMKDDLAIELKPGMVFALEPMVTLGSASVHIEDDGWTVVTDDGSDAAHFEHTVAITEDGHEILTSR